MRDQKLDAPKEDDPETKEVLEVLRDSEKRFRKLLVTLMVTIGQANDLQLATEYGTVSLALRNPLDRTPVKKDKALLSKLL